MDLQMDLWKFKHAHKSSTLCRSHFDCWCIAAIRTGLSQLRSRFEKHSDILDKITKCFSRATYYISIQFWIWSISSRWRMASILDYQYGHHVKKTYKYQYLGSQVTLFIFYLSDFLKQPNGGRLWFSRWPPCNHQHAPVHLLRSHFGAQCWCLNIYSIHLLIGATSSRHNMAAILDFQHAHM